jgi:hypothetical protein
MTPLDDRLTTRRAPGEAQRADYRQLRQRLDLDRNDIADVDQRGPDADRNGVDDRTQAGPDRDGNQVEDLLDAALLQLAAIHVDRIEAALAPRPDLGAGVQVEFEAPTSPGVDAGL